jgi:hypothetical protein
MKIKVLLVNFIPIFLLFGLLSYTEKFIHISGSVLGKLLAVIIVLFYSTFDILHGVLAAALVILYYQSDIVESMINIYEYQSISDSIIENAEVVTSPTLLVSENKLSYLSQYENIPTTSGSRSHTINSGDHEKKSFRKEHCRKGHLVSKEQKVPIDMAQHVYPEVSFVNEKCNICDSTCDFTVSETIISTGVKEGFAPISCRV